ncbi:zinc finger protein 436-like [Octopus sinensis]|uniref:Zinc finger protein 436-like n=1 Tax=Octopus sinensis TaxID=2607531 RepID=A0A6P7T2U5_9MOLL|nr:zinc finger protein 436-like [Octopus sinensis]XP_036364698.1 zinc finger protein 436-like [Octopus sinensis]
MNTLMPSTATLIHCDVQDLETAATIVHLNTTASTASVTDKTAVCNICGKIFSRHNLERHKRTHRGEKLFTCLTCDRSFSQKSHLTVHERIHTGVRPFKCNICGCAFSRKDYLVRHTRTQHSGKVYNINNQIIATPQASPVKKNRVKKSNKNNNANLHTSNAVRSSDLVYPQQQQQHHQVISNQIAPVTSNPPFDCEECWREYNQSQGIGLQKQGQFSASSGHIPVMPYVCDVCGKGFSTTGKLSTHHKIHSRPKLFNCDVCNKAFSRRDHLRVHKRIHSGERPFKCELCGYAFTRIDHLERHKRPNKGVRKLSCVPRISVVAEEGTSTAVTVETEQNGEPVAVTAAAAHHGNGNATTITTLTNVPHHITVQPHPGNVLYHTNLAPQISVAYHPAVQQMDVYHTDVHN